MLKQLLRIHTACIEKNISFASFRLPGEDYCTSYIQTGSESNRFGSVEQIEEQTGFLMAPFDTRNGAPVMIVKPDMVINSGNIAAEEVRHIEDLAGREGPVWPDEEPVVTGKEVYMEQVEKIRSSISTGAFQKAVLSRIRLVEGSFFRTVPDLFQTICRNYPNAFVYMFKVDEHFWIGASPEALLRSRDGRISTISLAGTRPYSQKNLDVNKWTIKEVLEQEYVTRYIHDVLRTFRIRDYRVTSPYVRKAGNLVHLATDFTFSFNGAEADLWEFIEAMHPTPAVAGQPKEDAISFIKNLEAHDREYYTGFLGPIYRKEFMDLFVNLRCIKVTPGFLALFVGGGITLESDPESEWIETRWKADGLLGILERYLDKTNFP